MSFKDLLLHLKIFSRLSTLHKDEECKLSFAGGTVALDPVGRFSWLYRTLRGDNRMKTIEFISRTYQTATQYTRLFQESTFLDIDVTNDLSEYQRTRAEETLRNLQVLRKELESSVEGLSCLANTYRESSQIVEQLKLIMEQTEVLMVDISKTVELTKEKIKTAASHKSGFRFKRGTSKH